jgi:murein DD-endopeptidase MepM/ murein hydrolase activator NlpD
VAVHRAVRRTHIALGLGVTLALVLVVAIAIAAGTRGSADSADSPRGPATSGSDPLRPHPRVAIALAPGESPPPGAETVYASSQESQNFRPPSDAEVRRELGQLRVAKLHGSGSYVDPLSQVAGLVPERIDMGVDYAGAGPVLALGAGVVFSTEGPGWPGGKFVGITLASGPYAGLSYFVAEDVKPTVRVGDRVQAGDEIAVMYRGAAGIETGWATGHGDEPLAAALGQQNRSGDPGAWSSAAGISFDRVLVATGTPSGIPQGTTAHGTLPGQYP